MSKTTGTALQEQPAQAAQAGRAAKGGAKTEKPRILFERPHALTDVVTNYCPGCSHGIVQRLVAETIDGLGIEGSTVGVCPVGCSVTAYDFYACDMAQAAHGRAPAVATGLKRARPGNVVFTYQGDGDLASIGMAETVHAATRGEKITVIFINNAIYGMTGGQMAPTTLAGMQTSTCPCGRDIALHGYPLKISDLLAQVEGTCLVTRQSVHTAAAVRKAKRILRLAFENSMAGKGTSIVEFVSACASGWKMTPEKANRWMEENMFPFYPLGDLKNK